jgi:heme/copper-type cytochrome/quinol oxidase subunit 2
MADQGPSNNRGLFCRGPAAFKRFWKSLSPRRRGILIALGVVVLVGIAVWLFKPRLPHLASTHKISDSSTVIGTFITLYVFFIGGFGVLVSFVAKKRDKKATKKRDKKNDRLEIASTVTITLLVAAAVMDLWRVLDSTGDLFKAATSGLSYRALQDDTNDFRIYFGINVVVVIFSIGIAIFLPGQPE